ncbi:hypothetical protein [Aquirhabdus sp.]|uniref:rhamnosyltransferase WsaF family glycosyltransferase n=1 Tax=Aquirhabdus sp. TaxID=2824160 RepID=UPI00396C3855
MYKYIDLLRKVISYRRLHGNKALYRIILLKIKSHLQAQQNQLIAKAEQLVNNESSNSLSTIKPRLDALTPLRTFVITSVPTLRISIITDSISNNHLFGGVGTALIYAAQLANRLNGQLRVITRTERAQPQNVEKFLSLYDVKLKHETLFQFAAFYDQKYEVDVFKDDLFITTSWWTTAATIPSIHPKSIIYLLQEDERMFYPFGDERYKCEAILQNKDIRFLINTELLFNHLTQNGLKNIQEKGHWFEPAFPKNVFSPKNPTLAQPQKLKLFFYARPNNPRNLFNLGIDVFEKAISQGVIDTNKWEIYFVGKDIPDIIFSSGYAPIKYENLTWSEYAQFIATVDLGLSLMYTPHPSYPPLDLAASGAVVVTNRYGNKQNLSNYSENIICADLERDALVIALKQAISLATDSVQRHKNYSANKLLTDWEVAFRDTIEDLVGATS